MDVIEWKETVEIEYLTPIEEDQTQYDKESHVFRKGDVYWLQSLTTYEHKSQYKLVFGNGAVTVIPADFIEVINLPIINSSPLLKN